MYIYTHTHAQIHYATYTDNIFVCMHTYSAIILICMDIFIDIIDLYIYIYECNT